MALEIERKYLVRDHGWQTAFAERQYLKQGYLSQDPDRTVRVRVADDGAWLTIKGRSAGASRLEYEYPIPLAEAHEMLDVLCKGQGIIEKHRYRVPHGAHVWEVDVFEGENAGLIVAEIELQAPEEAFEIPDWIGEEVTHEARYFNSQLAQRPFCTW